MIGTLTERLKRLRSSYFILFFASSFPKPRAPLSSLLDSQVRGWWVNTGVRSQISMIGMNNPMPAPLIYFTSVGREAGKWDGRKTEMQSKLGAGVLVYFLLSLGQTLWYYKKKNHYSAFFQACKGPFSDLINITGGYFPLQQKQDL